MAGLSAFLQALFIVPLTLLPIINPLSAAPVFLITSGADPGNIRLLARQVAVNCWFLIVGALLVGTYVLAVFGISLPIVRIGGGLLVATSGWRLLQSKEGDEEVRNAIARERQIGLSREEIARRSFFPLTFPLTTGPGTLAAAIAIGATFPRDPAQYFTGAATAIIGATLTAAAIYLVYRNAAPLLVRLGEVGALVLMRLLAFVLVCIGIQIMWAGWAELNGIAGP
jgi:multiple antibiotic resistance protein